MGGVDKNEQMKSYYTIPVSGKKWWSRILFDLIDRSIFNSFNLEQESPNHGKRTLKSFHIDLAKQLIGDFSSLRKRVRPSDEPLLLHNVERHFPEYLPTNESGKRKERRCKVCFDSGLRKMKCYFCPDCNVVSVLHHISAPFINNFGKTPKLLTLNHSYIVLSCSNYVYFCNYQRNGDLKAKF